jgi:hypothetical protein
MTLAAGTPTHSATSAANCTRVAAGNDTLPIDSSNSTSLHPTPNASRLSATYHSIAFQRTAATTAFPAALRQRLVKCSRLRGSRAFESFAGAVRGRRGAKALLARGQPGLTLGELHLQAMRLFVESLEKRKFAVTDRPRKRAESPLAPSPAAVMTPASATPQEIATPACSGDAPAR